MQCVFSIQNYIVPTEPEFGSSHFSNSFAGQALGIVLGLCRLDASHVRRTFVVLRLRTILYNPFCYVKSSVFVNELIF